MKALKPIVGTILIASFLAAPLAAMAADSTPNKDSAPKTTEKPKPYPLKTCIVSGDKLGGDMGAPYVFTYKGQEIKLCCKDCRKDFDKDPAKFMKKMAAAQKKTTDKDTTTAK
jgi:hypothetical protein